MNITLYERAERFVGLKELAGDADHPLIQWWLSLCGYALDTPDETAWCSAFVNGMAWDCELPRSRSAAARSWLRVGEAIDIAMARPVNDIVIFKRGNGPQPGPEVLRAQGHVGVFHALDGADVLVLGGNQSNQVSIARYPLASLLGVRRL